jgi:HPt (histidine-containing phosphotransfer) domain-containing protein
MINWDKVEELRQDIGAEDFGEIVVVFLEEVELELSSLAQKPVEGLGASMHFLKGSALNLGFEEFAEKCSLAEKLAAENSAAQIDLVALQSCYDASKDVFLQKI